MLEIQMFWRVYSSFFRGFGPLSQIKRKNLKKSSISNIVTPGKVSSSRLVPDDILKPKYYSANFGIPEPGPTEPEIKNDYQINSMRASCKLAANILKAVEKNIGVGTTTDEIDAFVHKLIIQNNAYPSPLHYKQFPKSVCTSVNNVVCHGIPDDRPLLDGDIINVDITVYLDGFHGDCSKTFLIGEVDEQARDLVEATEFCLYQGIQACEPHKAFSAIGRVIERKANQRGYKVVPYFIGHGIGEYFHGAPDIVHYRNRFSGTMKPGMTFTIEPILSEGNTNIEILDDNWTAVSTDNSRSAQFEHTILITKSGVEILTIPD